MPQSQVQELASLAFLERNENVVLRGPSGWLRGNAAGSKVRSIVAAELLMTLTTAHRQNQLSEARKRFVKLLSIDELDIYR